MRQTAQFLWIGAPLSGMERLCLVSFLKTGYDVHLYTYDDVECVPEGVIIKKAEEILPRSEIFTLKRAGLAQGGYSTFADRFRLHLLAARGGWWFDIDFISVQTLPEPTDLLLASSWEGKWGNSPVNAAMWCRPGDARMAWIRDEADRIIAERKNELAFGEIGAFLLQRFVRETGSESHIAPWWEFSPYHWQAYYRMAQTTFTAAMKDRLRMIKHLAREIADPDFKAGRIRRRTRAVHLYNEIWKQAGMDKNRIYHPASMLGYYQKKYGFTR